MKRSLRLLHVLEEGENSVEIIPQKNCSSQAAVGLYTHGKATIALGVGQTASRSVRKKRCFYLEQEDGLFEPGDIGLIKCIEWDRK